MPRNEAMFSRPCSMAPLPTQVCILVEACLALCKTKAVESLLGIRACWEVRSPGRTCSKQGLGGHLCPVVWWLLAREMPGSTHCWVDRLLVSMCENQTWGDYKPKRPPPKPRVPCPAQKALGDGVGKMHTWWKIHVTFLSYFPSSHC